MTALRRTLACAVAVAAVALAGCGGDDQDAAPNDKETARTVDGGATTTTTTELADGAPAPEQGDTPAGNLDCAQLEAAATRAGGMADMARIVAAEPTVPDDVKVAATNVAAAFDAAAAKLPGGLDLNQSDFEALTPEQRAAYESVANELYDVAGDDFNTVFGYLGKICRDS